MNEAAYRPPTVTVDGVLFQIQANDLVVLLIKRAQEPFKGEWALPGGYSAAGETTKEALSRVLIEKTGVDSSLLLIEQLHTFDSVARDPRGHAVSVTYMGLGKDIEPQIEGTQEPQFFRLNDLPELAYDHDKIIEYAHSRLTTELSYTNVAVALLPTRFTLTQAQGVYEAILGTPLDKRNFRKKIISLGILEETDEVWQEGAHRPARLYNFRDQKLQMTSQIFSTS